ncbi:MAG: bifunctional sulfate adenylyltransferase/adenylylsulfate kinase [Gammaproteobacteria bacterium]|nr:bifunctional sulfate adenylyltransferase/adenylylsulfate kinase [Gammaproteobacteria bacterium]
MVSLDPNTEQDSEGIGAALDSRTEQDGKVREREDFGLPEAITAHFVRHSKGSPKDLFVPADRQDALKAAAQAFPSWDLTPRQLCDLELLLNGGFAPLTGFLTRADYDRVVDDMRLADGTLWPMPITLDVTREFAHKLKTGGSVALRDPEGVLIAVLDVEDSWEPDLKRETLGVFGTEDERHPSVFYLRHRTHPVYIGGHLQGIEPPTHYDFKHLRRTPAELRQKFAEMGWKRIVAFQTRNPMHRAHLELTHRAAERVDAKLLINPTVGMTKPGDIDHYTRVRCYEHLIKRYPPNSALLSLLPLAMRMGGPREALWHALVRKNHGCTHFIVGRDHAGPGKDSKGKPFYGPYDAQALFKKYQDEMGIEMVPFRMMVYVKERSGYAPEDEIKPGETVMTISGTQQRLLLQEGKDIPDWFTYPEVVAELRKTHPPRSKQGFTVFFTGLSGSGKSTIANALMVKLLEIGGRQVTLLDGDLVRKHLSSELGFSKAHRDLNIQRIGYVASEITKNGGIAICAPIAPYAATRRKVREMIEPVGGFFEVYVSTPLEVCEQRDRKGLYAKARAGVLKEFTGVSDPYEAPVSPELMLNAGHGSVDEEAEAVLALIRAAGFVA